MAVRTDAPGPGAATRNRAQARQEAAYAMQRAAHSLAVEPAALSVAAYRAFRAGQHDASLPSPLTISLLFVGWQHACEHIAVLTCDEMAVEADVVRTLYGDPSCRRRAHATRGHEGQPRPPGARPEPRRRPRVRHLPRRQCGVPPMRRAAVRASLKLAHDTEQEADVEGSHHCDARRDRAAVARSDESRAVGQRPGQVSAHAPAERARRRGRRRGCVRSA